MASASEMAQHIGRKGLWTPSSSEALAVPVEVIDARERFAQIDLLVSPVGGRGQTWVSKKSVELEPVDEGQGG
jgi:hypothetical protein